MMLDGTRIGWVSWWKICTLVKRATVFYGKVFCQLCLLLSLGVIFIVVLVLGVSFMTLDTASSVCMQFLATTYEWDLLLQVTRYLCNSNRPVTLRFCYMDPLGNRPLTRDWHKENPRPSLWEVMRSPEGRSSLWTGYKKNRLCPIEAILCPYDVILCPEWLWRHPKCHALACATAESGDKFF